MKTDCTWWHRSKRAMRSLQQLLTWAAALPLLQLHWDPENSVILNSRCATSTSKTPWQPFFTSTWLLQRALRHCPAGQSDTRGFVPRQVFSRKPAGTHNSQCEACKSSVWRALSHGRRVLLGQLPFHAILWLHQEVFWCRCIGGILPNRQEEWWAGFQDSTVSEG